MKVLLAHKFFRMVGGGDLFFFETGRLLEEAGHEVAYLSTQHTDNRSTPFASYFVKGYDYSSSSPYQRARALAAAMYSRRAKQSTLRLIEDFRPDLAHLFGIFTHLSTSVIAACARKHVPVVMSCNDYKHICPNYRLYHHDRVCDDCRGGRFYKAAINRCCHESLPFSAASMLEAYSDRFRGSLRHDVATFLFASEFMAKMTANFWGNETFRWRVLRNPFTPVLSPLSSNGEYVLFFGRLIKEKGVQQLLRAAELMPEIDIRIVGDGDYEAALRAQAVESNLANVEFCGPVWGKPMDDMIAGARAVVVPSVWHENFPYVILQAFAAGKPVIGSDRGGIPEMIQHGTRGLVYPAEDHVTLAEAVKRIWTDPELCKNMGTAAQAYVKNEYGKENFMSSLMDVYQTVLTGTPSVVPDQLGGRK